MVEKIINKGTSMKIVRILGIGNMQLNALKDEGQITSNRDEVIKITEEVYSFWTIWGKRSVLYSG